MVVAQSVERLPRTLEIRGLNPVVGSLTFYHLSLNCVEKTKKLRKRGREWPTLKNVSNAQGYILLG